MCCLVDVVKKGKLSVLVALTVMLSSAGSVVSSTSNREDFAEPLERMVFICNAEGKQMNLSEVRYAYRGYLDEPHPVDNKLLQGDLLKWLGQTKQQYERHWNKMLFRRALVPPKLLANDAEVIEAVAADSVAVGYVTVAPRDARVKICGKK